MKNTEETKRIFLTCSCLSESLCVEFDPEYSEVNFAVFKRGLSHTTRSWRNKLHWIWHILKNDEPYSDEVILDFEQIAILKTFLISALKTKSGKNN